MDGEAQGSGDRRLRHRVFVSMAARGAAAAVVGSWLGAGQAHAGALLAPKTVADDHYNEQFTFAADLSDGGYLWMQLSITNVGPGSANAACRVIAVRPGRKPWTAMERLGSEQWRHDPATDTLTVGPCSARAGAQTVVRAQLDGGSAELRLAGPLTTMPPHSAITVGADRHTTAVLLPFANASASLQLPGQPAVTAAGGGYADHARSTIAPRKLAKRWVRFRALRGGRKVLLLARQDLEGRLEPAWILEDGRPMLRLDRLQLQRAGSRQEPQWTFDFWAGSKALQLKSAALLVRSAPLDELNPIVAAVLRPIVGSPVTFVHRASLVVAGQAEVPGLLEVAQED